MPAVISILQVACRKTEVVLRDIYKLSQVTEDKHYVILVVVCMDSELFQPVFQVKDFPGSNADGHLAVRAYIEVCKHVHGNPPSTKVLVAYSCHDHIGVYTFFIFLRTDIQGVCHDAVDYTRIPMGMAGNSQECSFFDDGF